ncbi:MAG: hypothetical protein SFV54_16495 [Bryobacteraceae bacterium]|nr:hypothetical protein [Bryobacteraceae bacterium]
MLAAIVPNHKLPRHAFATVFTTVDEVERHSGLDFFHQLEDNEENSLEGAAHESRSSTRPPSPKGPRNPSPSKTSENPGGSNRLNPQEEMAGQDVPFACAHGCKGRPSADIFCSPSAESELPGVTVWQRSGARSQD